jgi:hypothetical protein
MNAPAGQPTPWVVYDYEVDMLKQTWSACSTGAISTYPYPIPNALVESMMLHLRIVVDIFLSRGTDLDDIKLTDLLPKFHSPLIEQLKNAYGNRNTAGSPCWTLNKMLAHPTLLRGNSYNYDGVLKIMLPLILPLLEEVAQARQLTAA